MQRAIMTAAAAMLLGAGIASVAKADMYVGPVVENGKCFQKTVGAEAGFGYWTDCPKPAAAAPETHRKHARHHEK